MTFEAWQYHPQLPDVLDLARAFPDTPIMLNHVGGPLGIGPYAGRRDEVFASWREGIGELAACPNVWVKLGGLGMAVYGFEFHRREPRPGSAELADAWRPYIETCIEAFGADRGVFESNFPVDKVFVPLRHALERLQAHHGGGRRRRKRRGCIETTRGRSIDFQNEQVRTAADCSVVSVLLKARWVPGRVSIHVVDRRRTVYETRHAWRRGHGRHRHGHELRRRSLDI